MNRAQRRELRKTLAVPRGYKRRQIRIAEPAAVPPPDSGELLYQRVLAGAARKQAEKRAVDMGLQIVSTKDLLTH